MVHPTRVRCLTAHAPDGADADEHAAGDAQPLPDKGMGIEAKRELENIARVAAGYRECFTGVVALK